MGNCEWDDYLLWRQEFLFIVRKQFNRDSCYTARVSSKLNKTNHTLNTYKVPLWIVISKSVQSIIRWQSAWAISQKWDLFFSLSLFLLATQQIRLHIPSRIYQSLLYKIGLKSIGMFASKIVPMLRNYIMTSIVEEQINSTNLGYYLNARAMRI